MADLKGIKRSSYVKLTDEDEEKVSKIGTKPTGEDAQHVIAEIRSITDTSNGNTFDERYHLEASSPDSSLSSSGDGTLVYSYSNANGGLLESFWADCENEKHILTVKLDGITVMSVDMEAFKKAGFDKDISYRLPLMWEDGKNIMSLVPTRLMSFDTSVQIYIRTYNNKKLKAWGVSLVKL